MAKVLAKATIKAEMHSQLVHALEIALSAPYVSSTILTILHSLRDLIDKEQWAPAV